MRGTADPPPGSAGTIAVLCVDDEPRELTLLETQLEAANPDITVLTESHPPTAIERVREERVDCVVMDYNMPEMDGIECLRAIRKTHPDLPFILYTGAGNEEVAATAVSEGVTDYFRKQSGLEHYQLLENRITAFVSEQRSEQRERHDRRARQRQFELLVDSVEDYAIFFLDPSGHIATWNAGAENIKGYAKDDILGEHLSVLYPENLSESNRPEKHLEDAARWGQKEMEGWRVRKDGTKFYANATITAIHDDDELIGFAKVTRDMSRERYFQEVRRQKERMDRFAQYLTHDLSNMVRIAKTRIGMATRPEKDTVAQLEEAELTLDRMDDFIDPLSTLARQGEFVSDPEKIRVEAAARTAWKTVAPSTATLRVDDTPGVFYGDQTRIQQLFENVFQNTIQHVGEDATVWLGGLEDGFYVEDDGPGIPEPDRDGVFELGYTTTDEGSGFGLAIVKEIAEAHGWELGLTSGDAGGARFEFRDSGTVQPYVATGSG